MDVFGMRSKAGIWWDETRTSFGLVTGAAGIMIDWRAGDGRQSS